MQGQKIIQHPVAACIPKSQVKEPAQVGRFISEDPMGFDGGDVNLYVYAENNPVLLMDPNGLWTFSHGVNLSGYFGVFGGIG